MLGEDYEKVYNCCFDVDDNILNKNACSKIL